MIRGTIKVGELIDPDTYRMIQRAMGKVDMKGWRLDRRNKSMVVVRCEKCGEVFRLGQSILEDYHDGNIRIILNGDRLTMEYCFGEKDGWRPVTHASSGCDGTLFRIKEKSRNRLVMEMV